MWSSRSYLSHQEDIRIIIPYIHQVMFDHDCDGLLIDVDTHFSDKTLHSSSTD
jgi:hypothetical protein